MRLATLACAFALTLPLALGGCGGSDAPPPTFTPLSYSYLRPLRLNVGSVAIDGAAPVVLSGADMAARAPIGPADTLRQMATDRLVAAGASGRASFSVEQASITLHDGMLDGLFKVRLDIYTSAGQRAAYAEAAVARGTTAPDADSDDAMRAALYTLTQQMMSDMNVEFEFQLRRALGDWLQAGEGTAPLPVAVEQQPLPPPTGTGARPPVGGPGPDSFAPGTRFRLVPSAPPPTGQ